MSYVFYLYIGTFGDIGYIFTVCQPPTATVFVMFRSMFISFMFKNKLIETFRFNVFSNVKP